MFLYGIDGWPLSFQMYFIFYLVYLDTVIKILRNTGGDNASRSAPPFGAEQGCPRSHSSDRRTPQGPAWRAFTWHGTRFYPAAAACQPGGPPLRPRFLFAAPHAVLPAEAGAVATAAAHRRQQQGPARPPAYCEHNRSHSTRPCSRPTSGGVTIFFVSVVKTTISSYARRPRSHHESDDSCYPCVQVKRERRLPNGQTIVRVLHCPFCGSKTHTHGVTGEVNGTLRLSHCAQVTGESYELTM